MMAPDRTLAVPYFRPEIGEEEIAEVVETLRSGWLTTGPRTKRFEAALADAVGAEHAVAVNSCTAALHLAVDALGLRAGQAVLIPAMTFAATAEVIRYLGAHPVLVDCDPATLNLDFEDAERKVSMLRDGLLPVPKDAELVGVIPVHVGGAMLDVVAMQRLADRHELWVRRGRRARLSSGLAREASKSTGGGAERTRHRRRVSRSTRTRRSRPARAGWP